MTGALSPRLSVDSRHGAVSSNERRLSSAGMTPHPGMASAFLSSERGRETVETQETHSGPATPWPPAWLILPVDRHEGDDVYLILSIHRFKLRIGAVCFTEGL